MKINSYLKVIFHASSLLSCCYPVILVEFPPLVPCIALQERERVARISCATFSCCFHLCPVLALSVALSLAMQHKTINILWPFCWAHKSLEIDTCASVCVDCAVCVCGKQSSKSRTLPHWHTLKLLLAYLKHLFLCCLPVGMYTLPTLSTHPFRHSPQFIHPLFSQVLELPQFAEFAHWFVVYFDCLCVFSRLRIKANLESG